MSFTTVTTYTTKLSKVTKSDCICCAERRIITNLKREFLKKRVQKSPICIVV